MSMKSSGVAAGILLLVGVGGCAEAPVSAQAPDDAPEPAAVRASRTPQQMLADVAKAYQDAPVLTDEIRVEIQIRGTTQSTQRSFTAGPGTDVRLLIDGFVFTAVDGNLSAYRAGRADKYFQTPLQGDLPRTYLTLTGGVPLPVPQLAMRAARAPADYLPALGMQLAANMKPTAAEPAGGGAPRPDVIPLAGDRGATGEILVDPATNFMKRIEIRTGGLTLVATMNPKRHDTLPAPIAFDPAGRRRVDSMQAVAQLSPGDAAPDFTLPTLEGEPVKLSDLRGSLVVLDFWATWCGPCKMALPKLQQFQDWARAEGLAVEVLPINVGERVRGEENIKRKVAAFWKSGGYTMKTLVDYESSMALAFDVGPIPHSVVVGPDGVIRHVKTGFHPGLAEEFKQLARKYAKKRTGA
jgi:thiol-disulfide isomerase/thioredoxin